MKKHMLVAAVFGVVVGALLVMAHLFDFVGMMKRLHGG